MPVLTYRLLLGLVGLRTYVPYHLLTVLALLAAAGALYILVRRRAGGLWALAIGSVYLVFGSGYENYWWGFQIGFVASVAGGLWGFVLLDGKPTDRRRLGAALLFAFGCISCSPGALLLLGAIVAAIVRRDTRTIGALAVPALLYATWFLGAAALGPPPPRPEVASLVGIPDYVVEGLARTAGASFGILGLPAGLAFGAALVWVAAVGLRLGWRPTPALVGLLASAVLLFASAAVLRAYLGVAIVASSRYLYAAAPLVGVLLAETLPVLVRTVGATRRSRPIVIAVLVVAFDLALFGNVRILLDTRNNQLTSARQVRAALDVLLGPDGSSCDIDAVESKPSEVVVATLPGPSTVRRYVALFGDPRTDSVAPGSVIPPTPADHALARRLLCHTP